MQKKRLLLGLFLLFLINTLIIVLFQSMPAAGAASLKEGSRGSDVKQIQTKLKEMGYYSGTVDGVYGTKTKAAVKYFQSKKGLKADGICGPETLAALGIKSASKPSGVSVSRTNDLYLLSRLISAEARGEPYNGQVAVGAVILNRTKHPSFPNTISAVIYQPGAFTCITDGQFNQPIMESSKRAAQDCINGLDPSDGSIYYYNPATATSKWIFSRTKVKTIGKHVFAK